LRTIVAHAPKAAEISRISYSVLPVACASKNCGQA
jgi:hypothetical protein